MGPSLRFGGRFRIESEREEGSVVNAATGDFCGVLEKISCGDITLTVWVAVNWTGRADT